MHVGELKVGSDCMEVVQGPSQPPKRPFLAPHGKKSSQSRPLEGRFLPEKRKISSGKPSRPPGSWSQLGAPALFFACNRPTVSLLAPSLSYLLSFVFSSTYHTHALIRDMGELGRPAHAAATPPREQQAITEVSGECIGGCRGFARARPLSFLGLVHNELQRRPRPAVPASSKGRQGRACGVQLQHRSGRGGLV